LSVRPSFEGHHCASSNPRLVEQAQAMMHAGLAPTTHALYQAGANRFEAFVKTNNISPTYPTDEETLCLFVTHLCSRLSSNNPVSATTARAYVAGVYHRHEMMGMRVDHGNFRKLAQTLRGAERLSTVPRRVVRTPITVDDVTRAANHLPSSAYNSTLCIAAMYLASGAALRISELLGQNGVAPTHSTSRTLRLSQLTRADEPHPHLVLTLYAHKTDQQGRGTNIIVAQPAAVAYLSEFVDRHSRPAALDGRGSLLFVYPDGTPLSSRQFLSTIRPAFAAIGFKPETVSGHSFRKGGATGLVNAGNDDSIVRAHGRWKSNIYHRYVVPSRSTLIDAARKPIQSS
jgi:integrase